MSHWFWNSVSPAAFAKMNGRDRMMMSMRGGAGISRMGVEEKGVDGMRTGMRFGANDAARALGYTPMPTTRGEPTAPTLQTEPVSTVSIRPSTRQVIESPMLTQPRQTLMMQSRLAPTAEPMTPVVDSPVEVSQPSPERALYAAGTAVKTTPEFAEDSGVNVYEQPSKPTPITKAITPVEQFRAQTQPIMRETGSRTGAAVSNMLAGIPLWLKVVGGLGLGILVVKKLS